MSTVEIPLIQQAELFTVSLDGVKRKVKKYWVGSYWAMDFMDIDGNKILSGVPLLVGVDLVEQFKHLGFNGVLEVVHDQGLRAEADYDTIGIKSHLHWST